MPAIQSSTCGQSSAEKTNAVLDCTLCNVASTDRQLVVYEDQDWVAYHSKETNILGYVVLTSREHQVDLSEMSDRATANYGKILRTLMQAIREVTDCARIYTFSLGESVPHYHLHMIPRTDSMPRVYRARGVMQYPLVPTADEALVAETCSRLKNAIARLTLGCKQK